MSTLNKTKWVNSSRRAASGYIFNHDEWWKMGHDEWATVLYRYKKI